MKGSLIVIVALLMTATVATAQHQHGPLTEVQGKDHPEQIPDILAFHAFFRARSASPDADAATKDRVERRIRGLGLSTADELQFRLEMTKFRASYDDILSQYEQLANQNVASPKLLYAALLPLMKSTLADLKTSLSSDGLDSIRQWILYWKHSTVYQFAGDDVPTEVIQ